MKLNQTIECDVIARNGKYYANVKNVHTKVKFEEYSFKFENNAGLPIITETINRAANAHWRPLFEENLPFFTNVLSEVSKTIFAPIFKKIAIQEFLEENCKQG